MHYPFISVLWNQILKEFKNSDFLGFLIMAGLSLNLHLIICSANVSLYSNATQNHLRWVLLRHLTQKIVLLHHLTQRYQHVGIFCIR